MTFKSFYFEVEKRIDWPAIEIMAYSPKYKIRQIIRFDTKKKNIYKDLRYWFFKNKIFLCQISFESYLPEEEKPSLFFFSGNKNAKTRIIDVIPNINFINQ